MEKLRNFIDGRKVQINAAFGLLFILIAVWAIYLNYLDPIEVTEGRTVTIGGLCLLLVGNGIWHLFHARRQARIDRRRKKAKSLPA